MRSGKCATRRRLTSNLLATLLLLVQAWDVKADLAGVVGRLNAHGKIESAQASLCGWAFRARAKGDFSICKTEMGKGSKRMRVVNGSSLPTGLQLASTQPRESVLAEPIVTTVKLPQQRCDPSIRPGAGRGQGL
jgi:hypothetical protein